MMTTLQPFDRPDVTARLLQPPPAAEPLAPAENSEDITLAVDGATLTARFYEAAKGNPTLLYFHGGEESCDTFTDEAEGYRATGLNVLVFSYRGFGGSTGNPSLATLLGDADSQFLQAIEWLGSRGHTAPLFVFGRSLGSLCAVSIASGHQEKLKGLILESAYCQGKTLLQALGLEEASQAVAEGDSFGVLEKMGTIKLATSIFHGSKDELVPIPEVEKLQASSAAKTKQFLLVPGARHGNVARTAGALYYKAVRSFVDTVCGLNTWRDRRRKFQAQKGDETR